MAPTRMDAGRQLSFPPFWRPLSEEERFVEWMITDEFCALIGQREVDRAVRGFKRGGLPAAVSRAFLSDPIVMRMIVYAFNPHRDDLDVVPILREYVDGSREPVHLNGLAPSLVGQGVPLKWTTNLGAWFKVVWRAQDLKADGDPRAVDAIIEQLVEESKPTTTHDPDGVRTVRRSQTSGGAVFTTVLLERPDGTKYEEYLCDLPEPVDPERWCELVDRMLVRYLQQWPHLPELRDSYFSADGPTRRVMKLLHRGQLVAERPMHLTEIYGPKIKTATRGQTFEAEASPDLETGRTPRDPRVSQQEALLAMFEAALSYQPDMGWVPGVLAARMRGALTTQRRRKSVSRKVHGQRALLGNIEHSGDAIVEAADAEDGDDPERRATNALETHVDTAGHVHRRQDGAYQLGESAVDEDLNLEELVASLTPSQQKLALILAHGGTLADAARKLKVSRAAVSQMLERMRPRIERARAQRDSAK